MYILLLWCVYNDRSVQSDTRRHSAENTTLPEGLKRSERLRDRRVHYADMVHGIHPRHGGDAEPKPDKTVQHHHIASKASLPHHRESCSRSPGRTSSTDSHAKPKVALVEAKYNAVVVNYRRPSMELRSSAVCDVAVKPASAPPLVTAAPLIHSGGRHRQTQREEIPHGSVESAAGTVECGAGQTTTRPATAPCRRHRGSARHRRRMAARRRRSKLVPLSSPPANPLPEQLLKSSTGTVPVDCSQQNMATVDSRLVDEPKVGSHVKSVKFTDGGDASVLSVASADSGVVKTSPLGCRDSLNKTSVSVVSAVPFSCRGGTEKHVLPLSNCVRVMHVDFSGRVGRRRHSQEGIVLLDRYVSADAACVCCCSCPEMLSVSEFVRHVHHAYRVDVKSDRRLGPCGIASPEWFEFQRRRAEFADSPCHSETLPPPEVCVTQTTASQVAIGEGFTGDEETSVPAVDEVEKSTDGENLLSASVAAADHGVVKEPMSTPLASHDTKNTIVETNPLPPVPAGNEVSESSSGDPSPVIVGSGSRPSEPAIVTASCPAAVDVAEPRVTRSRSTSTGHAEPSPNVPSLHKPSATAAASPSRHSSRSCKRARMDSPVTTPVRHATDVDSIGSRLELRPRPPPRATATK